MISVRDSFFYFYFMLMFGMRMWGVYEGKAMYAFLIVVALLLWTISFLMTEYTLFEYLWSGLLLSLAGIVYINSGEKGLLFYFTLLIGMKNVDVKSLFKWGVVAGASGMMIRGFLTTFGLVEDIVYIQERSIVGDVLRHALGAPHPNTLGTSMTVIAAMVLYIIGHDDRKTVCKTSVVLFLVALFIYVFTQGRTGLFISIGVLLLNLIYTYRNSIGFLEKCVLALIMPILIVISVFIPAFATEGFLDVVKSLDFTLYKRLTLGQYYFQNNAIVLWGQRLNDPLNKVYGIDLSLLYLFLQLGVIAFAVIMFMWGVVIFDSVKNNRTDELVIIFSFLLMGVTDPFLYNISFKNIAFVFIGITLFKYSEQIAVRMHPLFCRKIRLFNNGEKLITVTHNLIVIERKDIRKMTIATACFAVLMLVVVFAGYVLTPNPNYVLLDRNTRSERSLIKDAVGKAYTTEEIAQIRNEGNIVINYSGEDELMYTYYSDQANPVVGGVYAPNLPKFEKIRFWLGVFFWGMVFFSGSVYLMGGLKGRFVHKKHNG